MITNSKNPGVEVREPAPLPQPPYRPHHRITMDIGDTILEDGLPIRIAMSKTRMRIGCTEVDLDAAKQILELHRLRFGDDEQFEQIQ